MIFFLNVPFGARTCLGVSAWASNRQRLCEVNTNEMIIDGWRNDCYDESVLSLLHILAEELRADPSPWETEGIAHLLESTTAGVVTLGRGKPRITKTLQQREDQSHNAI